MLDTAALDRLRDWGGPTLLSQMVHLFLDNSPTRLEQIRTGVQEGEARNAERGAHSLKSSAANVGAMELSRIAARIEEIASRGDLDAVEAERPSLEAAFERVRERLESTLAPLEERS